jgi:hypothetical protein
MNNELRIVIVPQEEDPGFYQLVVKMDYMRKNSNELNFL